jgi:putative transposase
MADTDAAKHFFRTLLVGRTETPRVIVTDKLKSYAAAKREILPKTEHRQSRYLNNRWRFRTNQHDDKNGRCSGSSRRAKHSASYPLIAVFTPTSSCVPI